MRALCPAAWLAEAELSACKGKRPAKSARAKVSTPTKIGKPHQNPRFTKISAKIGASAVPTPRRALSVRIALSTRCGKKTAVNVFSAGTTRPNPAPRNPVAVSKTQNAGVCRPAMN